MGLADRNSLLFTNGGCLRLGDVVDRRLPVWVSDGENMRRVYDWARFEDQETVWIRTRRGLELEGSATHRLLMPDGAWRRLDQFAIGDHVRIGAGPNVWAEKAVALDWKPTRRFTLTDAAEVAGVDVNGYS